MNREKIMKTFMKMKCEPELVFAVYVPRRAATMKREKPIMTIGIGSKIVLCNYVYHHIYIDFDNKNIIQNIVEYAQKYFRNKLWVIKETSKGYHLHVYYPFTRKEVDSYIARIKNLVDPKWLTLQRKRGFYVIRIAGKYNPLDIRTVMINPNLSEVPELALKYGMTWFLYLEHLSRILHKQIVSGELGEIL